MRASDHSPALFILALSAIVLFGIWDQPYWTETAPGPAFLPVWLVGGAAVIAVLAILEVRRGGDGEGAIWPAPHALLRVALTYAGLVAIPVLSPVLGMVPCAVLFMIYLLVGVLRQPLVASLATVAITGGVVQVIFVWWLKVALPTGIFGV